VPAADATSARGFILQATYRTLRGRAVVHLHGVLEGGATFLVRDGRLAPYVYIREDDLEPAGPLLGEEVVRVVPAEATDRRTLDGEPVVRLELRHPGDTPDLRGRLLEAGVVPYEADVRFAQRYLIDRGIRSALAIDGPWRPGPGGVDRVYDDPHLASPTEPWVPELSVLSFDIETDPRGRVLSVAFHGPPSAALAGSAETTGISEVWLVRAAGGVDAVDLDDLGGELHLVASEAELLDAFCRRVREIDPDVLTGWNVVDFDLAVLLQAADRLGTRLEIGRGPGRTTVRSRGDDDWRSGPSSATVPGRLVLDGIQMLQGAHVRMESYSLEAVSREVLGRGKVDLEAAALATDPGDDEVSDDPLATFDKGAEVVRLWREEPGRLARYNLEDARLVTEILQELQLVELAVERSALTGLPPDRLAASVAAFDFVYLSELGRRGRVARSVGVAAHDGSTMGGGAVYEPVPGLWEQVAVLDFKSLYPSLIRTFGLDPLLHLADPPPDAASRDDLLVAPNGAVFERPVQEGEGGGILPALLDELFPRREAAKERGDRVASYAIKILMNSFYGVLGTSACRFYDPELANAITSFGRAVLAEAKRRAEAAGFHVLYGDTDSLFVATGADDPAEARRVASDLAGRLDRSWTSGSATDGASPRAWSWSSMASTRSSF
jgi:DNA polymerase-2